MGLKKRYGSECPLDHISTPSVGWGNYTIEYRFTREDIQVVREFPLEKEASFEYSANCTGGQWQVEADPMAYEYRAEHALAFIESGLKEARLHRESWERLGEPAAVGATLDHIVPATP